MSIKGNRPAMFEYQAPATLNQAAPVQNTWYDLLPTTLNCRVYDGAVNIEDDNETLEVQIIIDGVTLPANDLGATQSTAYFIALKPEPITRLNEVSLVTGAEHNDNYNGILIEGHSVQIQVRKTTAAGAGNLTGIVAYGVLTPI